MVAGAQVVGRPRKAAKTETNNGSLLKLMSIELVMLSIPVAQMVKNSLAMQENWV